MDHGEKIYEKQGMRIKTMKSFSETPCKMLEDETSLSLGSYYVDTRASKLS
jgi:hypothetical protein